MKSMGLLKKAYAFKVKFLTQTDSTESAELAHPKITYRKSFQKGFSDDQTVKAKKT